MEGTLRGGDSAGTCPLRAAPSPACLLLSPPPRFSVSAPSGSLLGNSVKDFFCGRRCCDFGPALRGPPAGAAAAPAHAASCRASWERFAPEPGRDVAMAVGAGSAYEEGPKYCYLMAGVAGQPSCSSRLCSLPADFPGKERGWGWLSSVAGERVPSPGKVGAAPAQEGGLRRDFAGCLPSAPPGGLSNPAASFLLQAKGVGWINTKISDHDPVPPQIQARGLGGVTLPRDGGNRVQRSLPPPRAPDALPRSGLELARQRLPRRSPLRPVNPAGVRPRPLRARSASPAGRPRRRARPPGGGGGSCRPARSDGLPSDPRHRAGADRCGPGCRGWK